MRQPIPLRHLATACLLSLAALWPGARAAQPIVAGSLADSPPMIADAGHGRPLRGVLVDLAAAMSRYLPAPIEFRPQASAGLLAALHSHRIDVAFTLMHDTSAREQRVDFIDFFHLGTRLLVRHGNPQHVKDLHSLCGKAVATLRGSTQLDLVTRASEWCTARRKPPLTVLQFARVAQARRQLRAGHVVALLGDSPAMLYLAHNTDGGHLFALAGPEYQPVPVGIAVPRNRPKLREELQVALQKVIDDGSYLKILRRYGVQGGAVHAARIDAGAAS